MGKIGNPFASISAAIQQARSSVDAARKMGKGGVYQGDGHSQRDERAASQAAAEKAQRDAVKALGRAQDLVDQYRRAEDLEKGRRDLAAKTHKNLKGKSDKAARALRDYDNDVKRGNRQPDSRTRTSLQREASQTAADTAQAANRLDGCKRAHGDARGNHSRAKSEFRKLNRELTR